MSIKRALLSVSDKTGILEFARALRAAGVELLSTGGTAGHLARAGVPVTEISDYTEFPEMMAGRLKTLHPRVHGGLLGRRGIDDAIMREQGIPPIDLVAVNLYPFEEVIEKPGCSLQDAIENIDIGGPAMLRAAAKNHAAVTLVTDPDDYAQVLDEMNAYGGAVSDATRYALAVKGFAHTARYDAAISNHLGKHTDTGETTQFPSFYTVQLQKRMDMRYGENPHQRAALYAERAFAGPSIVKATQLQGKSLSFNNVADADAALTCVQSFNEPVCVIVKHANPCGVAVGKTLLDAYERAYATDPKSAFGGTIAVNRCLDAEVSHKIIERQFVELILAPEVASDALGIINKKSNVRVLAWNKRIDPGSEHGAAVLDYRRLAGGLLVQEMDRAVIGREMLKSVTRRKPSMAEIADLLFAWRVIKHVKSNAIVYVRAGRTLGIGAGQMSRVDSARIAMMKAMDAGIDLCGAVMASDAFFPFRDSVELAAEAGIAAIIQPGGSRRDEEVIAAADKHDMTMTFTGMRHFRH